MALKPLENESAVLGNVSRGDHAAFCLLFDHYQGYIYGFGRKLTRSDDQAQEIVQDIFMKIWLRREKLLEIDRFEAYLTRLIRNQAYTLLRKSMSQNRISEVLPEGDQLMSGDLNTEMDYRETLGLLNEAIQLLPEHQRRVYELCHQQGLKYDDAAKELNISADTVHYHMKLALRTIREHFKKNAFIYPLLISCLFK